MRILIAALLLLVSLTANAQNWRDPTRMKIGGTVVDGTATRILFLGAGPVLADSAKYTVSETAGAGMTIAAGTAANNVPRALSVSQTWTDGTTGNIGVVVNVTEGTATGKLLSLQSGASGTAEVFSVSEAGRVGTDNASVYYERADVVGNATSLVVTAPSYFAAESANFSLLNSGTRAFWIERTTGMHQVSGAVLGFSSSATNAAAGDDTAISRISAGVIGVGTGAAASVAGTLAATNYRVASTPVILGTAPTLASGGCTSPTAVTSNGTAAFSVGVGTSCSGSQPLVFTLPAATTGWQCTARNTSNAATSAPAQSSAVSTTSVTITSYSRTTGLAQAWTDSDVVAVSCLGY